MDNIPCSGSFSVSQKTAKAKRMFHAKSALVGSQHRQETLLIHTTTKRHHRATFWWSSKGSLKPEKCWQAFVLNKESLTWYLQEKKLLFYPNSVNVLEPCLSLPSSCSKRLFLIFLLSDVLKVCQSCMKPCYIFCSVLLLRTLCVINICFDRIVITILNQKKKNRDSHFFFPPELCNPNTNDN